MESQLGDEELLSLQTRVPVRMGHNFGSDRWISLKSLQEFPDAVFLRVDVESLLGEAEGSLLQTRVPVRKGHNFLSDRWMTLKILEEFTDAVFLGVDVESLVGRRRARRSRPEYRFEMVITLDPTVGSQSNLYRSFWTLFYLE